MIPSNIQRTLQAAIHILSFHDYPLDGFAV